MRARIAGFICMAAILLAPLPLAAEEATFQSIVSRLEHELGIRQERIPMMGLASFLVQVASPGGVRSVHLAIFEDISTRREEMALAFQSEVERATRGDWYPMVRVASRRNGEFTSVFAKELGKHVKVLVAVVDEDDAVLVELKVSPAMLRHWLNNHEGMLRDISAAGEREN
jgi:hypothetical protein